MGIPKFIKTLIRRYPLIVGNIKNESDIPPIDNLYLDIKSILHLLSHSREHNLLALTKNKTDLQIYEETYEFIHQIVELIRPKSFLMIVLDGVCPIAKISNQVISRYVSSLYKFDEINSFLKEIELENINDFDGNKIFPCTDFMIKFEEYLDEYICTKKKENKSVWRDIEIIFSGTNVPGEGEYKIMEHIREQKEKEKKEKEKGKIEKNQIHDNKNITKYCIFSGDADYILLCLLIHEPNIVILKAGTSNKNQYDFEFSKENNSLLFNEFIYISVLREFLFLEFKNQIKSLKYNLERIYEDFSFICLLLGNDYIPALLTLDINDEIFEILLNSYKESLIKFSEKDNYLTNNGRINFENFKIFINKLADKEDEYIIIKYDFFEHIYKNKIKYKNSNSNETLLDLYNKSCKNNEEIKNNNNLNSYEKLKIVMNSDNIFIKKINYIINEVIMRNDIEYNYDLKDCFIYKFKNIYEEDKFKAEGMYYNEKFQIDINAKKEREKLSLYYLAGLQWNLYYYKGFLNWNYNNIYNYSPLILTINRYMNTLNKKKEFKKLEEDIAQIINENNINEKEGNHPLPPYILQCLIFPSNLDTCSLIPSLYLKIKEIINDYYKFEIKIDNNGFPYYSQTTVICPKIHGKENIKKLIEFDQKTFKNTINYTKIKEKYGKDYLYYKNNKNEYKHSRKNEIYNECYEIYEVKSVDINGNNKKSNKIKTKSSNKKMDKKADKINDTENINIKRPIIDINFPSLEIFNAYNYTVHCTQKNCKYKTTNNKKIFIYISLKENQKKIIKKFLDDEDKIESIFKDKIISYGYPLLKIGIINGIYYENKYYTYNEEKKKLIKNTIKDDYYEIIEKDYLYIGLNIDKIICLIDVLPINSIDYDYQYKYFIPLEITSLLYKLEIEDKKNIIKNDNNMNKYLLFLKENMAKIKSQKLNTHLLEKEKEIFLFDEDSRNKKIKK